MTVCCAECGSTLMRTSDGWWGCDWIHEDGHPMPGNACSSGYGPDDHHVPDLDLPLTLDPEEVEAWLAAP